jgi:MFS family permease
MLVFGEGIAFIFFYLVVPVTVVYATRSVHAGPGGYAAILASWGAGAVIGSTVHIRLARRVGHATILLSTAAVAVAYVGTALAPALLIACGASVLGGIGNGTQWASVETAVHGLVDESFRLRVSALLESMAALAPGVGIILGGALSTLFSPRAAYLAAGLGLLALIAVAAFSRALSAEPALDAAPALGSA